MFTRLPILPFQPQPHPQRQCVVEYSTVIKDRSGLFTQAQLQTFQNQIFTYRYLWRTNYEFQFRQRYPIPNPPLNFHNMLRARTSALDVRLLKISANRRTKFRPPSPVVSSTSVSLSNGHGHPECSFCHTTGFISEYLVTLESCQHIFCVPCLQSHIRRSTEAQIPCPQQTISNCKGHLLDPEIKQHISSQEFEAYLLRSLTIALEGSKDLSHCFVEGCPGICAIEDGLTNFYCPVCNKLNCTQCKTTHQHPCQSDLKRKCTSLESLGDGEDHKFPSLKVAMKGPKLDTPCDIQRKKEWEESWDELCEKFQSRRNSDENSGSENNMEQPNNSYSENFGIREKRGSDFSDFGLMNADKEFECSICYLDVVAGGGVILQECFHKFCRECLAATIQHSEDPVVKCPFQSGNYSCPSGILDKEVKALVTAEVYEAHLKKSLNKAELTMANSFHCKLVNCPGWVEVESGVQTVICQICSRPNCVPCKAIHQDLTCIQYQNCLKDGECDSASQRQLNDILKKGDAMRCPTCKVIIEKTGGCDSITCTICKTMLCWPTQGPRWGPRGVGDTSGGCGCTPAKRCHPKCNFCH